MALLDWMAKIWETLIERPRASIADQAPVIDWTPELVPDPDPPLTAHVMFCPKCAAERGSNWRYAYRPTRTVPLTENIFFLPGDLFPRQEILTATLRDECIRVICGCGYHWNEQTATKTVEGRLP